MKQEFYYPSKDGLTQIHAIEWIPETEVRGILQIAHGMVEFIERYDGFASFMASHGFYVTGNDHLGHGRSVKDDSELGFFADHDGNSCVIGDMRQLREDAQKKYPGVPYFILGHSMGSFLTRQFIEEFGEGISGAVIMGTGHKNKATLDLAVGLTSLLRKTRGEHYRSSAVNNMALGSYNKSFKPARTKNDWLTKDASVVDAYEANPLNQFTFTVNGYYNMFRGMRYAGAKKNIKKIPKDLPILVVSGGDDPVGDFGKAPAAVAGSYKKAGIRSVTLKLYPGDRHEILNELDKDTVYNDLLRWMESNI